MEIGHWRKTKVGSVTYPIALNIAEKIQVVEPVRVEGRGSHRRYIYPDNIHVLIHLEQSGSGRRSVHVKCKTEQIICENIRQIVEQLWVEEGGDAYGIAKALSLLTPTLP
jgi:hypothetical protein